VRVPKGSGFGSLYLLAVISLLQRPCSADFSGPSTVGQFSTLWPLRMDSDRAAVARKHSGGFLFYMASLFPRGPTGSALLSIRKTPSPSFALHGYRDARSF